MTLLALPQPGPAGPRAGLVGRGRLQLEHRAQAQAEQARAADAQQVAAGHAQVAIAQVLARGSGNDDHRELPCSRVAVRFDATPHRADDTRAADVNQ